MNTSMHVRHMYEVHVHVPYMHERYRGAFGLSTRCNLGPTTCSSKCHGVDVDIFVNINPSCFSLIELECIEIDSMRDGITGVGATAINHRDSNAQAAFMKHIFLQQFFC